VSEPAIHLYPITAPAVLTFNDIEIIMDNWNQMQEIRKQSVRESAEGVVMKPQSPYDVVWNKEMYPLKMKKD
jgi:ATP-dependent DNA ligase